MAQRGTHSSYRAASAPLARACWLLLGAWLLLACAVEPQYLEPGAAVEVGIEGSDVTRNAATLYLPIRLETEEELTERTEEATELGVEVPYVRIDDLSVSVEWTIKNLSDIEGIARLRLSAGNEWFYYVPDNFLIEPQEVPEILSLVDGRPRYLAPYELISGVVREKELREAALDLELMTRAAINPFTAVLGSDAGTTEFVEELTGIEVAEEFFAGIVRLDVDLEADVHMVLDYTVRVRDHRGILHDELLDAPPEELSLFAPAEIVPATEDP